MGDLESRDNRKFSFSGPDDSKEKDEGQDAPSSDQATDAVPPPAAEAADDEIDLGPQSIRGKLVRPQEAWRAGGDFSKTMKAPEPGQKPPPPRPQSLDPASELGRELAMFRDELRIDPKNLDLLTTFAEKLVQGQQTEEAKGVFLRILKLEPGANWVRGKLRELTTPDEFRRLELPPPVVIFWHDLSGIIKYAFTGDGVWIMLLGSAALSFFVLCVLASLMMGLMAVVGLISFGMVCWMVIGYLWTYYFSVVKASAIGKTEPPGWPPFSSEILWNMMRVLGLMMYWHLPSLLVWTLFHHILGLDGIAVVLGGLVAAISSVAFTIWWPMAFLALAQFGDIMAIADPRFVFASIAKILKDYAIAWLFLTVFLFISGIITSVVCGFLFVVCQLLFSDRIVATFVSIIVLVLAWNLMSVYRYMTAGRVLGLLYRQNQTKLGWFIGEN